MQPHLKISKSKQRLKHITADDTVNTPGGPVAVHETDYGPLFCGRDIMIAMAARKHYNYGNLPSLHKAYSYNGRKNIFLSMNDVSYVAHKLIHTSRADAVHESIKEYYLKHFEQPVPAQESAKSDDMHAELEDIKHELSDKLFDVLNADMDTLKDYIDNKLKNNGTTPVESTLTIELRPLSQVLGKSMTATYRLIKNGAIKGRLAEISAGDPTSADSVYTISRNSLGAYMEDE